VLLVTTDYHIIGRFSGHICIKSINYLDLPGDCCFQTFFLEAMVDRPIYRYARFAASRSEVTGSREKYYFNASGI
jgi:hypothetical protein